MAKRLEVYKCEVCGNIVEMYNAGGGTLVCCGEDMKLQEEKTADSTTEKHVPVIEKIDGGYKVTVGTTLHPMKEEHYIQWIELIAGDKVYTEYLSPGMNPEAVFMVEEENVSAREYCNLHGHWKSEK
jgi:superoxide reductase